MKKVIIGVVLFFATLAFLAPSFNVAIAGSDKACEKVTAAKAAGAPIPNFIIAFLCS